MTLSIICASSRVDGEVPKKCPGGEIENEVIRQRRGLRGEVLGIKRLTVKNDGLKCVWVDRLLNAGPCVVVGIGLDQGILSSDVPARAPPSITTLFRSIPYSAPSSLRNSTAWES